MSDRSTGRSERRLHRLWRPDERSKPQNGEDFDSSPTNSCRSCEGRRRSPSPPAVRRRSMWPARKAARSSCNRPRPSLPPMVSRRRNATGWSRSRAEMAPCCTSCSSPTIAVRPVPADVQQHAEQHQAESKSDLRVPHVSRLSRRGVFRRPLISARSGIESNQD